MTTKEIYTDEQLTRFIRSGATDKEILNRFKIGSTTKSRYKKRLITLREVLPPEEKVKQDVFYGRKMAERLAKSVKVDVEGFMTELGRGRREDDKNV